MSNKELNIIVKVTDQASKQLQAVSKDVESFANKNKAVFEKMAWYWAIASAWLVSLGTAAVQQASKLQDLRIELDTLTWSAENGMKLFADIQKAAAKTPFESADLVKATSTMLQFWVAQEDVMKDMMMLGDISWGNANRLSQLSLVYGQVASAGKLTGQDLLQLINVWFNPLKEIADSTWESMASLRDKMSDWEITFEMIRDSMQRATWEWWLFFEMMDKKSQTFSWVMSTLKDNASVALASLWWFANWEVVEWWLLDMLTDAVNMLTPKLQAISERAAANPEMAKNIFIAVTAVTALTTWIWLLWMAIPAITAWLAAIGAAMSFLALNPIWLLITTIWLLATAIYLHWDDIVKYTQILSDSVSQIWNWLKDYFTARREENGVLVTTALRVMIGIITGWMSEVVMFIYNNRETIKMHFQNGLNSVRDLSQQVMDWVQGIFTSIFDTITNAVDTAVNYVVDKVMQARDSIKNFASNAISSAGQWFSNAVSSVSSAIPWFAEWWRPKVNKLSVVGERWPELFVPWTSWTIVPNNQLWPSINLTFWNFNGAERSDAEYIARVVEQKVIGAYNNYFAWLA